MGILVVSTLAFGLTAFHSAIVTPSLPDPYSGYELRVSGFSHNYESKIHEHGSFDLGGSVVFPKISTDLTGPSVYLVPRAHIGGTANFVGNTSFVYAGLTWTVPITDVYYFSYDFGGALNNGELDPVPGRAAMGCHATFRESGSIGRPITKQLSVAITFEHFSNAKLCDHNDGITNVGLTFGYRF